MSKRKTRTSMADQNNHGSSKTAEGGSGKAARVTPVPEGARRPPPTPTASDDTSSYDVSVPFEFRNWQVGSRFHIKRFLGRGSYGSVCEATDKLTGERVAIKRITDLFDVKVRLCPRHTALAWCHARRTCVVPVPACYVSVLGAVHAPCGLAACGGPH